MTTLINYITYFALAIAALLAFTGKVHAQQACAPKPERQYYHPLLDSAGSTIQDTAVWINFQNAPNNPDSLNLPFYQGFDPLLLLREKGPSQYDNKPEDGWDVMYHNFGFTLNRLAS